MSEKEIASSIEEHRRKLEELRRSTRSTVTKIQEALVRAELLTEKAKFDRELRIEQKSSSKS